MIEGNRRDSHRGCIFSMGVQRPNGDPPSPNGRTTEIMEEHVTDPRESAIGRRTGRGRDGQRRGPIALLVVMLSVELLWIAVLAYVVYRVL